MANKKNQQIQRSLGSAGNTVSYKEASKVAQAHGVSVDRVYNQTAKTGQAAKAGSAAANAGYIPSPQLKIQSPINSGYAQQLATNINNTVGSNRQPTQADLEAWMAANAAPGSGGDPNAGAGAGVAQVPEFDWQAWNSQMMAQQAAVWESMDAMNSEFLRQQQAYLEQQKSRPAYGRSFGGVGGSTADQAQVKRKKQTKSAAGLKTNTGLSTGSAGGAGGSGVSLGGTNSGNGLSIGKA